MKVVIFSALVLSLSAQVGAQTVDHYALGLFAPNATTPIVPPLTVPLTACNATLPPGWPPTLPPLVLTPAPITAAKVTFDDPLNVGKVCSYDIFLWLNTIKTGLAPGPYASKVQWVATDGSVSPWFEAGSTGFLKPAAAPSLPAVLTNLRILR